MDRNTSITSNSFIKSTFMNININSDITIGKIKEMISSIDNASKSVIIPVLKIKKKICSRLQNYIKNYNEIKDKVNETLKELSTDEEANNSMNINNMQLSQKFANEHEELIYFYDKVTDAIDLFTNLFKSESFNLLIKGFDNIINDEDIFESIDEDIKEIESIDENIQLKKNKKDIKKKKSDKMSKGSGSNTEGGMKKIKKSLSSKEGAFKKKLGVHSKEPKKKKIEKDLLEIVQKQFPDSNYVQKISKTFLQRRLNKKVIYKHVFKYNKKIDSSNATVENKDNNNDGENINANTFNPSSNYSFTEEREKSSGDSTVYKYSKFTFIFDCGDKENKDSLINFFTENYLKHSFIKDNDHTLESDNIFSTIIAGRLSKELSEVLSELLRTDKLPMNYHVKEVVIEFYEFYEDLASEFQSDDDKVTIDCDEKTIEHLRNDYKMLEMVREFVINYRKKD